MFRRKRERNVGVTRTQRDLHTDIRTFTIHGGYGDSVQWQDYERGMVYGFVPWDLLGANLRRPLEGDLLEANMASGRVGVFRFTSTEWCSDPNDMFTGRVEPVGYKDELDA